MKAGNSTAIVTGAAGGIGAAIALALAGRGWNVLVTYYTDREGAEATASNCARLAGDAAVVRGDVAQDVDCRASVTAAVERWGRLDCLVNNAGMTRFVAAGDLDGIRADDFQRIYNVNVVGVFQMARAAAPLLRRSKRASIVNVSSHSGMTGLGSSIAYAASKGALNTLTLSLARTLAPEIRVNALCPGFVDTNWVRRTTDEAGYRVFKGHVETMTPLRSMVQPDDVAEAALWLIEGGRAITGDLLVIDGGNHLTVNAAHA